MNAPCYIRVQSQVTVIKSQNRKFSQQQHCCLSYSLFVSRHWKCAVVKPLRPVESHCHLIVMVVGCVPPGWGPGRCWCFGKQIPFWTIYIQPLHQTILGFFWMNILNIRITCNCTVWSANISTSDVWYLLFLIAIPVHQSTDMNRYQAISSNTNICSGGINTFPLWRLTGCRQSPRGDFVHSQPQLKPYYCNTSVTCVNALKQFDGIIERSKESKVRSCYLLFKKKKNRKMTELVLWYTAFSGL